jgi:small GTP-binding protein
MKFDEKIQLIIVGESSVGKTSLLYKYYYLYIIRYTQGVFTNQHLATVGIFILIYIGLEYFTKEEKVDDKVVRVKIWDTAGQEQYKSLTRNFYRNSDGVIIVYDVTNKSSFEKVQEWVQSIIDNTDKGIKMVLVGNKIDLTREVTSEEGKKLADFYKVPFFETSAKENTGISEFIRKIISDVLESFKPSQQNIQLQPGSANSSSSCKC